MVKGEPLLSFHRNEGGNVAVDFEIHDKNLQKVAVVKKNAIYPVKEHASNYEISLTVNTFTLRDVNTDEVLIDIRRRSAASSELDVHLKTYMPDGRLLDISPKGCNLPGIFMKGCILKDCKVGISIG
jgi:hypothetical protein